MIRKIVFPVILTILSFNLLYSQQHGFGCVTNKHLLSLSGNKKFETRAKPVTEFPPVFGNKARQKGNSLPLPFGTGIYSIYYDQAYTAGELALTTDSSDITARADTIYQNTSGYEFKVQARPNLWILPFLNIYGIFGYTKGVISPNLVVPHIVLENVPVFDSIIVDTTFEIHDEIGYTGPTYGIGATFSKGFGSFFVLVDYNFSVTQPVDMDDQLWNHFLSPKLGLFIGNPGKKTYGAFWIGAMYIKNEQFFTGKIDVADINADFIPLFGEEATYSGEITPNQRWNFVAGYSLIINEKHHFVIEGGLWDRKQISIGYDFRF